MWTDTVYSLQMLCMHQKPCKFIAVFIKTEEDAYSYVINTALHCSVHSFGMICIIVFRPCRVQNFIIFLMICFLKQDICAYACLFELSVIFNGCCGNININTANCSVFMLYGIDCIYTIKNVLYRVVNRILSGFNCKTLMTHILKSNNLLSNLLLR